MEMISSKKAGEKGKGKLVLDSDSSPEMKKRNDQAFYFENSP